MRTKIDKRDSRLDLQRMEMLNQHTSAITEKEHEKEKNDISMIFESAYNDMGSVLHNKRVRQQNLERNMTYNEHFAVLALTEALSECANKALLLNTDEYAKLNPNYQAEIKSTIKNFLEQADINDKIDNKAIIELYGIIKEETPLAEMYLSEEDEKNIISDRIMSKECVERKLDDLARDVRVRVANIVTKDQEGLGAEQDVIEYATKKELDAAPVVQVQPKDEYEPLPDPEVDNAEQPEENMERPVVTESVKFVKNSQKRGIIETLALNEAMEMISDGKEYDKTLALANAIKYVTILECLDASGIVCIGTPGYNRILSASGVNMNPVSMVKAPGANITNTPVATDNEVKPVEIQKPVEKVYAYPEDKKITEKISELVKSAIPEGFGIGVDNSRVFEPIAKWRKENGVFGKQLSDIPVLTEETNDQEDLRGKYTNMKGQVFTESALKEFFENQGFDLNYVDFEDLWKSWHFKKH